MKKTNDEIIRRLADGVEEITLGKVASSTVVPANRIITDLGLDSLDYATLLLDAEEWLGIKIREAEADWRTLQTVAQLAEFLEKQQ